MGCVMTKEEKREYYRKWREKNINKIREYKRLYYYRNIEKERKARREYARKHKEQYNKWKKNNPEKLIVYRKRYYDQNKKMLNRKSTEWQKANRERVLANRKITRNWEHNKQREIKYKIEHAEEHKKWRREYLKTPKGKEVLFNQNNNRRLRSKTPTEERIKICAWIKKVRSKTEFKCYWCDKKYPIVEMHIDHVVPLSACGVNRLDNLCTACKKCNLSKQGNPITVWVGKLNQKEGQLKLAI